MRKDLIIVTTLCVLAVGTIYGIEQDRHERDNKQFDAIVKVASDAQTVNDTLAGRVTQLEGQVYELRRENDDLRNRLSNAAERDRARQVRASRSRRLISNSVTSTPIDESWVHSVRGIKIANCESADLQHWPYSDGSRYLGGERGLTLHDARYTGKWQIGPNEWRDWGGLQYASAPWQATEAEQDAVAQRGYNARGEQPWSCARMV